MSTGAQIAAAATRQREVLPPAGGKAGQRAFGAMMLASIAVAALVLLLLVVDTVSDGAKVLSLDFLTSFSSRVFPETAGIRGALVGTLWLMAITALIVVPLGVMTAVYLEEYADRTRWFNRLIELNLQNLASVPSVVYGILGLAFIVRGPVGLGPTITAGAITLALLVLPVVIIVAREAIRAVPVSIREGALALGATKWQTVWKQVLPGSVAGIATGVILALSRAIGETAPLLLLGAALAPLQSPGPGDQVTAMPLQIFAWIQEADTDSFLPLAAGAIIVLLAVLLLMNSVAIYLRNRYEQKW